MLDDRVSAINSLLVRCAARGDSEEVWLEVHRLFRGRVMMSEDPYSSGVMFLETFELVLRKDET